MQSKEQGQKMTFETAIYGLAAILLLAGITEEIILRRRGRK